MRAMEELPRRVKIQLKFVQADPRQIQAAIETYYQASPERPSKQETQSEMREVQAVA